MLNTLTDMVTLEALKLVDVCLWKTKAALVAVLVSCPFTRTTNATDGILSKRTRKFPLSAAYTSPVTSPDPDASTRATSVRLALSLPVTDTSRLPFTPFKDEDASPSGNYTM